MKIADARNRFKFEQTQKTANLRVSLERDFVAEIDEERLIAGSLELRGFGWRSEHAGKLYCWMVGAAA